MIELRVLGSLDLRDTDGRAVGSVLAQPKRLALLVYLALGAPGGFVRRDTLLATFWPESDDERARGALRQAVRYLRRSLGEGVLVNRSDDELGVAAGALRCDAADLRAALGRGDAAGALALYRGELLDGFFVADSPGFERWLEAERAALRAEATAAAWTLADAASAAGDPAAASEWGARAVALAPLEEPGVRRLMAMLDAAGDRAGAVRACEAFTRRLETELDLEPAPQTRALDEEIRRRETGVPERGLTAAESGSTDDRPGSPAPLPAAPERSSGRAARRIAAPAAVAVLALSGLAYVALPRPVEPPLNPRRVVVAPFENRTGDAALDPVGSMAADWIIQGLAGRGALEVVPVTAALASARQLNGSAASPGAELAARSVARETGAGTAVVGAFYLQGDSLHFHARITDAATGRVLGAIGAIGAPLDAPLEAIDGLRERVLLALAPLSDARDTHVRLARAPPSYEAYRAYVTGFESFIQLDFPMALRHFERAAAADSAFLMPVIAAGIMHTNLGNAAAAEAAARRVERSRELLGTLELASLDMLQGWLRGDDEAAYEAAVRQARIAPGSIGEYQVAEQARRLNRPRETVRVLTAMGSERGELRGWFAYWRELTAAHHMLGAHREELRAARRARELYPTSARGLYHEVLALAALGRVAEVNARVEERLASPSREWPNPGALMAAAARELRAHGRADAAQPLLERSIAWYRSVPAGGPHGWDARPSLASVLYEAGRWEEAREIFAALSAEDGENVGHRGHLGVIAARLGDRARAERISAWLRDLERPYLHGAHTLWRARIAAVLGEREEAVDLLRRAFAEGRQHGTSHHTDIDLDPLGDHSAFRALMRPRE
jgi:DNA-binding SARP family transcriptional activator/tetratricopeptide (TPR) repeat protein